MYMGLGGMANTGAQSCLSCEPPEGYYPIYGMAHDSSPSNTKDNEKKNGTLNHSNSLLQKIISKLPDKNLQNGLNEYLKVVKPEAYQTDDVGGANEGISKYFEDKFNQNKCFQDAAVNFYTDVATTLKKHNKCESQNQQKNENSEKCLTCVSLPPKFETSSYGCTAKRPSLNDQVGRGSMSYLDEGWIMRLALKHSKGNPEAALDLIGMCGHDDTEQGEFMYFDSSEKALTKNYEQVESLKQHKKMLDTELKKAFKTFDTDQNMTYHLSQQAAFTAQQITSISGSPGRNETLSCPPQASDYYAPGSLSHAADIPSHLKEKIKTVQGNGDKSTFLPAKHYHVYGSALLGCKMAQNGIKPEHAVTIQKNAARFYRGLRMCNSSKDDLKFRDKVKKFLQVTDFENTNEIETKLLQTWEEFNNGELNCISTPHFMLLKTTKKKKSDQDKDSTAQIKCEILESIGIYELDKSEKSVVIKKISNALGRMDAAKLYDEWYIGGESVAGINTPCTDHRNKGPSDLMNPNEGFMGKLFKPNGWTKERYEVATKRLATWDVDFEWTVAQHEAGSQYGAKLCSESKNKKNPFADASCTEPHNPYKKVMRTKEIQPNLNKNTN